MWTASFWNAVQHAIPEGGTVCPVIIASDKTNLTRFSGNKSAYPIYLTIGNLPKALRQKPSARACVLIAYLSVDKPDKKRITKKDSKLRVGIEMVGGDGDVRMVYPLLSIYVADYPEQCLVTCTKYGTCPKCKKKAQELSHAVTGDLQTQSWTQKIINKAYKDAEHNVAGGFEPFWAGFPLTDIHQCITPDILHQCYQGVFVHLLKWVQEIVHWMQVHVICRDIC
ncbi:hypothetical protein BDP27DRAFT_1386381 [Rhodocollybia butyracea]|uniref:Uncharacterized protein n=1 Tax=Rhodocollybia butyracea TaxID=206335 RepID=A0A9P5P6X5_9AGAR|nr:hypothetical protein BDP27DRAFT_1386381 [Rhodocollybia butyracea]